MKEAVLCVSKIDWPCKGKPAFLCDFIGIFW